MSTFDQLNEICHYEVLKYLKFNDLLKLEQVNSKLSLDVESTLKRWKSFFVTTFVVLGTGNLSQYHAAIMMITRLN